jgi:hypothetical protein
MTPLESRLRAALAAVAQANEKISSADAAMAKLRAAIDDVTSHQSAVNALAIDDAQAFETWARAGDDTAPPAIDAAAHHAASLALIEAQKKAAAANSALTRIEAERTRARLHGEAEQKAILPLAAQIAIPARVQELLDEHAEYQTKLWHVAAQIDEAHKVLIEIADTMPKGGEEAREVHVLASKLWEEIRNRRQGTPAQVDEIRAAWRSAINATIDAHANNEMENEVA